MALGFSWTQARSERIEPFTEMVSERAQRERKEMEFLARGSRDAR